MKRLLQSLLVAAALLAGCRTKSPYDYLENWLIREDPVRAFAIPADIIYVQGTLFTKVSNVPMMLDYARTEVGNGRFNGIARVFSPLVASQKDLDDAIDWYFRYHHKPDRPFVFIGEGEGGRFLKAYEDDDANGLRKKGLAVSYYTDEYHKGFVTDEMVKDIKIAVMRARYRLVWGREMPEDMPK